MVYVTMNTHALTAGLLEEVAEHEAGEGRLLRELHDHRAAHGDARCDLPGQHEERKVP